MHTIFCRTNQKAALAAFWFVCTLAFATSAAAQEPVPETATATDTGIPAASAVYDVFQLEGEQDFGDFVVGPGKFDLTVAPGETETVEILVTNRSGIEKVFTLTTEDMTGSDDLDSPTVLLGDDVGPYTLKDYLSVPANKFVIAPGERVTVPITVSLPADAEPGGRYGRLLVQTASTGAPAGNTPSAAVVSRIAVLFFVSTPGELDRSGELVDFVTVPKKTYFSSGPITFGLVYENTGTVHTNPAGEITIHNMFGQEVGYLEVLPWFSLPQSLRLREVEWERASLLGRYTAEARVYRGFGETIDTKTITFWVIDWTILAITTGVLAMCIVLVRFVSKRFTFVRKDT